MPQDKRARNNGLAATQNGLNNGTAPKLTLSQLESHLWESANILRGPVDAADFKTYIFPLLFFKRLSDVDPKVLEALIAGSVAGVKRRYPKAPSHR